MFQLQLMSCLHGYLLSAKYSVVLFVLTYKKYPSMSKAYLLLCILMIKMRQIDQCFPHDLILSTKETKHFPHQLEGYKAQSI